MSEIEKHNKSSNAIHTKTTRCGANDPDLTLRKYTQTFYLIHLRPPGGDATSEAEPYLATALNYLQPMGGARVMNSAAHNGFEVGVRLASRSFKRCSSNEPHTTCASLTPQFRQL